MRSLVWLLIVSCVLAGAAVAQETAPAAQPVVQAPAPVFEIHGVVKSGAVPLPGVSVTASHTLTGKKVLTSTDVDGSYRLVLPARGKYVVRVELSVFAPQTSEVVLKADAPAQKADFTLVLVSRVPKATEQSAPTEPQLAGVLSNARGTQRLTVTGDESALQSANESGAEIPLAGMPALASSSDAGAQSVGVSGQMGASQDFGMRSLEDLRDRIEEARQNGQPIEFGGGGGFGGPGAFVMGGPGGGGGGGARGIQRFNSNRPHGSIFYNAGNAALDATPYSLTGEPEQKPDYASNRFGFTVGGPLVIPHIYNGANKDFLFLNYTGTRSGTPSVGYANVPTMLERAGNFSQTYYTSGPNKGQLVQLYDPATGAYLGQTIASGSINSASQKLLSYIPAPNQTTPGMPNFLYSATADTVGDNASLRWTHNFNAITPQQRTGNTQARGAGGGGRGGARSGRPRNNLNVGLTYSRNQNDSLRPFPTVGGTVKTEGWNLNAGWNVGNRKFNNTLRVTWNVSKADTTNRNTGVNNVANTLGISGASANPSDWGVPGLSFANYQGLNDVPPSHRLDQTLQFSEALVLPRKKHNLRMGVDYRRLMTDLHSNGNANGTFTFTGFATAQNVGGTAVQGTGYDFADFLLGDAQQTTVQYSPYTFQFRANSYDFFAGDDWRVSGKVTINAGIRYEYIGPYTELQNRLVNLAVTPGFTSAVAAQPGQSAPCPGYCGPTPW
jgi:hypothetical protein